jgi:hypothetical protein
MNSKALRPAETALVETAILVTLLVMPPVAEVAQLAERMVVVAVVVVEGCEYVKCRIILI